MKSIQQSLIAMLKEHSARKHLTVVVGMIAIAMVISVAWSLHINGITLASTDPTCGLQEHVHTEACYDWVVVDGTESIDSTEGTEALEATEVLESTEAVEVVDSTETAEVVNSTETAETIKVAGSTETADATLDGNESTEAGIKGTEEETDEASANAEGTGASISASVEEGTESLTEDTEEGTEALMENATEDATEGVTEEATESPLPGDIKVVDGVTYVYELVCGLEEHTHTDECYPDDGEEDTEVADASNTVDEARESGSDVVKSTTSLRSSNNTDSEDEEEVVAVSGSMEGASEEESEDATDNSESGIATISEDESESNTTTSNIDLSDYYLATTVDAGSLTSENNYIIYTVIDGKYYVLTSDNSLAECTTVSSVSDATGDGPYYIESTGTIVYGTSSTAYSSSVWTMTQSGSGSYYYAKNSSTDEYLAVSGGGSDSDVTIGNAFSARTGEITFYGDFTLTYTFKNTSSGSESYENYIVEMVSNGVYLDVRSDNYGWFANQNSADTLTFGDGLSDWTDWTAAMQAGAEVTVTITRTGTSVVVTTTAAKATFTATAYVSEYADSALTVYLTGENCTIGNLTYSATVNTVQLNSTSGALTCGATGATISGTPLSLIASISSNALTWADSSNTTGAVFYFAEAQDAADNYHFAESVTLTDAAENQDDSYVVYTKIDGIYYIVSAVDGSLLECTDLTDSSYSDDEKVLLSAAAGVYIWDYDDTTGEPEFKFTTGTDDSGEDIFEDYRWTVSSSDYNTTSGTGTYTLNNANNEDYLAPDLETTTVKIARYGSASDVASISDYGTIVFSVTIDGFNGSSPNYYSYLQMTLTGASGSSVGIRWNGHASVSSGPTDWVSWSLPTSSSYSFGDISLSPGDEITIAIISSSEGIYFNFYNENTAETFICFAPGTNFSDGYSVSFSAGSYGSYTITSATAGYDSSVYGVSNAITQNSIESNGVYSYTIDTSELVEVGKDSVNNIYPTRKSLSDDFDITYSFTNTSTGSVTNTTTEYYYNYAIEITNGSGKYITLRADDVGWTYGCDGESLTYQTAYADFDSWADWQKLMESGAACTVRVIRTGDNFFFITTATNGSTSYTFTSYVTLKGFGDDVEIYLMGQGCTLSDITYVNNTAREYNEKTYNRVSSTSKSIVLTAVDSNLTSVDTDSYLWYATATGSYSEKFTLIGQLATDTANTAEIEWVENATTGAATSGTAVNTLANESAVTLSDTVAVTFSLARVKEYYVWFDGTNGGMSSYSSNSSKTAYDEAMTIPYDAYGNLETITTPTTITDASGYGMTTNGGYTLRGWYDIYNGNYYEPGEKVSLTDNTVMYADWEVTSYNIAEERTNNLADTVSTNSFITTRLFDYNELFNAQSTMLTDSVSRTESASGNNYTMTEYRTLTLSDHRELFNFSSSSSIALGSSNSLGFLFFRTETYPFYYTQLSYTVNGYNPLIDFPDGRGGTINASGSAATTGILGDYGTLASSVSLLTTLFGTGNTVDDVDDPSVDSFVLGKTYVGTADYLFQYDEDTGYYYYNSAVNAASYYADENRFYVYDYKVMANTGGSNPSTDDFLPYNYGTSGESITMNNINYWFGMSTEIEFYLPDDVPDTTPTTATENLAIDEEHHMTFKFSGDDDVWVFIDGELVLDLGGVHGQVYGEIDFSTGEVTVVNTVDSTTITLDDWDGDGEGDVINYTDSATTEEQTSAETYVRELKSGTHTLTFYYLERGSSQSNAAIYFNILSTQYNLNLAKVDEEDTTTSLDGAEFTFYTDSDFTELAEDLEDKNGNEKSTFSSSETVYGLREGKLYYVLETASPDGYSAAGKYFTIILKQSVLTITVYDSSDTSQEIYVYNLTYNSKDDSLTVTRDSTAESGVTNAYDWDYILGDTATFSATTSGGTVSYYTIGFSIANTKEYELPSTGSIGLFPYERAGAILVLASVAGLLVIAFYDVVQKRRVRTNTRQGGYKEEKAGRAKRFTRTRDRPRERSVNHGHARDRPGDR